MDEPRTNGLRKLKIWFLFKLSVLVTFFFIVQMSTDVQKKWQLTLSSQHFKSVLVKGQGQMSQTSRRNSTLADTTDSGMATVPSRAFIVPPATEIVKRNRSSSDRNKFTAVLLLTYMRSGSSLTGAILQRPKDAFYLFEPLRAAAELYETNGSIAFLNGTILRFGSHDFRSVYLETLLGWLTCDFTRVHIESLLDIEFLSFGKSLRTYTSCIRSLKLKGPINRKLVLNNRVKTRMLKKCLNGLQTVCLRSKYRIVKTIRIDMSMAGELLKEIKESKIVHLIRDPRATIESKSHRKVCLNGLTPCIQEHCERVREDTALKGKLDTPSSGRFHTVRYEDIATNPVETAKKVYAFLEMGFKPVFAEFVYNITLGEDKTGCRVCTQKWQIGKSVSSSETHVEAWKRELPSKFINRTQQLCSDVIKHYGYEYYIVPYQGNGSHS